MNLRLPALVLILLVTAACGRQVETLRLVVPELPVDQTIAEHIATLVEQDTGVRIELVPLPAGQTNALDALEAGQADLAIVPNSEHYREGISTIVPLYPTVLHIAIRASMPSDADFRTLLEGRVVYTGAEDSAPRQLLDTITDALDLPAGAVRHATERSDDIDIIMLYAPIDRDAISRNPHLEDYRLYSIGKPGDIGTGSPVDTLVLINPRLRPFVLPASTYGNLSRSPVVTVAVDNLLVARKTLPREVAFDVFAEVLRLRPALFGERPELYAPLGRDLLDANFAFAMHPGAVAFLQQDEPTYVERYSGVAEVVVTLMVALVSGGFAVLKIYRIRRKNRIDRFYVDVIAIRDAVGGDAAKTEREQAITKIRQLQNQAFEMLVDERLAADESFRIFIELTNNAIDDIKSLAGDVS